MGVRVGFSLPDLEIRLCGRVSSSRKKMYLQNQKTESNGLTGPSPKSFSGFWNDILSLALRAEVGGVDVTEVEL